MKIITILGIVAMALMAESVVKASSSLDSPEVALVTGTDPSITNRSALLIAGETFSIAVVADPQYADTPPRGDREPAEGVARLSHAVSVWNQRSHLDWGIILGDIIDWDDVDYSQIPGSTVTAEPQDWAHADAILAAWNQLNIPKYLALGNHDFYVPNKDVDGLSKPYSVYRKFGFDQKAYYSFQHKGFRFIVLMADLRYLNYDPTLPEYQVARDYYDAFSGVQKQWYNGAVSVEQRIWFMEQLDESTVLNEPVVCMMHDPIHQPEDAHSLLNNVEILDILNGYRNVVMWMNGHNHAGEYDLEGTRHHVNLKGMQSEAENWYEVVFSPDRVLVYQAEVTNTPIYDLDISMPQLTIDSPLGFAVTNTAGTASLSWSVEPPEVTTVVIEARHVTMAAPWQEIARLAVPSGGSYGHTPSHPAAEYKYRIRFEAGTELSRYSEALSPGEAKTSETEVAAGPIGWWKFDEGMGSTSADSSENDNAVTQAGIAGSWITGKTGSAYQLGGSDCRLEVSDSSDLQVTGAVTVSAWVNPTANSRYGLIAGIDQTGGAVEDMYALKTDSGDKPYWQVTGPAGTNVELTASSTLATLGASGDGWVHLVGVYDPVNGFAGLYVNGVLDVSTTTVPTSIQLISATDFQMGHNAADSGDYPLNAAVDDVQIYDEALSAAQVAYLYNNPGRALSIVPVDAEPIGWWKFDDGSGTNAVDSSGNGYDLDQVNSDGSWTTGKAGGGYNLPRFTADTTDSDALNLAGSVSVSLSAWVTAYDTSNWAGIAGFEGTGADGDIYSLKLNNDDTISWTVNGVMATTTKKLTDYAAGEWIHLVGVYDENSGSILYVNGENAASATPIGGIVDKTTPSLFRIGTYYNSNSYKFNGSIDDVQLYQQALSVEQVAELYNNPGRAIQIHKGTIILIR